VKVNYGTGGKGKRQEGTGLRCGGKGKRGKGGRMEEEREGERAAHFCFAPPSKNQRAATGKEGEKCRDERRKKGKGEWAK
jgi:hypothetical protein